MSSFTFYSVACRAVSVAVAQFGLVGLGRDRRVSKVSARSLEIGLNKFGTGVDVDLPQRRLARIDEAVRRICRNNNNAARFYFARFVANRDRGSTFNREGDFSVRMRM